MKNMKVLFAAVLMVLIVVLAFAAQDTTLTERELRNPKTLLPWLEDNASDAETRIAAVEAAGVGGTLADGKIIVGDDSDEAADVDMSGDATIDNAGALTLADAFQAHTVTITNVDGEDGSAVVTVEIRDGADTAVDACVEFWLSDTDGGAPASQTATASVGTAGTQVEEINADYQYRALTASGDLDIDLATADTGYVVVIYKSEVYSAAFTVTGP
jgi:hypothetical protein